MSVSMPEQEATQMGGSAEGAAGGQRPVVLIHQPIQSIPWSYDVERAIFADRGVDIVDPGRRSGQQRRPRHGRRRDRVRHADRRPDQPRSSNPAGIVAYSVGMDYIDQKAAAAARHHDPELPDPQLGRSVGPRRHAPARRQQAPARSRERGRRGQLGHLQLAAAAEDPPDARSHRRLRRASAGSATRSPASSTASG